MKSPVRAESASPQSSPGSSSDSEAETRRQRNGRDFEKYSRQPAQDCDDDVGGFRSFAFGPLNDERDDEQNDAVNELLVAAGLVLGRKRGTNILAPHRYVIRGSRNERIGMEKATWPEYVAALCHMSKDEKLPAPWSKHVFEHLHQLATMASNWDWHTCRQ